MTPHETEALRDELRGSRLQPNSRPSDGRILGALRTFYEGGSVFLVLTATPEQFEDVYRILVDDNVVLGFELRRDDSSPTPQNVEVFSVSEYEALVSSDHREELKVAVEVARSILAGGSAGAVGDAN